MKYSVFTVSMPSMKPEQIVKELEKIGYDAVEWRIHDTYHFDPKTLEKEAGHVKKICDDAGLAISSISTYVPATDVELGKSLINAAAAMNAKALRLGTLRYEPKEGYKNQYGKVRKALEKYEPLLGKLKVKLLIEIHHETLTPSASTAFAMLNGLPPKNYGALYDPANLIVEGREQMGFEILGPYLGYVHAKDVRFIKEKGKWDREWCSLGEGMVDWKQIYTWLKKINYNGFISSENLSLVQFREKMAPKAYEKFLVKSIAKELAFLKKHQK